MLDKFGVSDKVTVNKTTRNIMTRKIIFSDSKQIEDYLVGKELVYLSPNINLTAYYLGDKHLYCLQLSSTEEHLKEWISANNANILLDNTSIIEFCKSLPDTIVITDCTNIEETL